MLYCTRSNVHVDRCASAWLIKRFIDPDANFVFVDDQVPAPGAVPFDMHGVEWGHRGNRCTFEVLCDLHGLEDPAMRELARMIHGADIASDADETLESAGIDLVFRGVRLVAVNDHDALEGGYRVMDGLYAAVQERINRD